MKIKNPFSALSRFELILWISSLAVVFTSYILSPDHDAMSIIFSLIGVTALIFVSKGLVIGQVLSVVFAIGYAIISFSYKYYGEMFTYAFMTAPSAIAAIISWLKNPYQETNVVMVATLTAKKLVCVSALGIAVSVGFYFILGALGTSNLVISTLSVLTSFIASAFTFLRSPYYAIAYSVNDLVLITMWVLATLERPEYVPMIFCFVMFLANDIYGFINWKRLGKEQKS